MPARAKGKAQGKAKAKAQPAAKRQRTCAPEGTIGLAHAGMGSLQRHRIMKPEVDEDLKFKNDLQQFKNDLKEFKLELYEVNANPPPVDDELKQLAVPSYIVAPWRRTTKDKAKLQPDHGYLPARSQAGTRLQPSSRTLYHLAMQCSSTSL